MKFYSQIGQDRYLFNHYFAGRCGLTFVDIGAYDGETFSNTLFFEETLGWTGLCIEPLPDAFEKLQKRRRATCIRTAIADYEGKGQFLEVQARGTEAMLSGLAEQYEAQHKERLAREATSIRKISVPVRRLDALLEEAGIRRIDYCSIDTEGAEHLILSSIDPDKYEIGILSVENNYKNPRISDLLEGRGYRREKVFHGYDELYVHNSYLGKRRESPFSLISIVVPSRLQPIPRHSDGLLWVERAIASIKGQRGDNPMPIEVIVGIDRDAIVPERIRNIGAFVRFARPADDRPYNQASALNAAIDAARGPVLAILEDDGVWHPDRLRAGLRSLGKHDFVSSNRLDVDLNDTPMRIDDTATLSGWMFHRHVWHGVGSFNESMAYHMGNEWLARLNQTRFTRCHQMEANSSSDIEIIAADRPFLAQLIGSMPAGSILCCQPFDAPLVRRTVNRESTTGRVISDSDAHSASLKEIATLAELYDSKVY
jgi:FkbM family methyltransferase